LPARSFRSAARGGSPASYSRPPASFSSAEACARFAAGAEEEAVSSRAQPSSVSTACLMLPTLSEASALLRQADSALSSMPAARNSVAALAKCG